MIVVSCRVAIKDIMMGGFSACFGRLLGKIILRQMGPFPVAGHICQSGTPHDMIKQEKSVFVEPPPTLSCKE